LGSFWMLTRAMTGIIGRKKIKNIQKEEDNLFDPHSRRSN
jgi:hypothetical protein